MLESIPPVWRDRALAALFVALLLALVGRKVGARVIAADIAAGRPERRWARVLVELGPGIRSVSDTVGPFLPPPMRAALDSLRGDSDPPGAK